MVKLSVAGSDNDGTAAEHKSTAAASTMASKMPSAIPDPGHMAANVFVQVIHLPHLKTSLSCMLASSCITSCRPLPVNNESDLGCVHASNRSWFRGAR